MENVTEKLNSLPAPEQIAVLEVGQSITIENIVKFTRLANTKTGKRVYETMTLIPGTWGLMKSYSAKAALANARWYVLPLRARVGGKYGRP